MVKRNVKSIPVPHQISKKSSTPTIGEVWIGMMQKAPGVQVVRKETDVTQLVYVSHSVIVVHRSTNLATNGSFYYIGDQVAFWEACNSNPRFDAGRGFSAWGGYLLEAGHFRWVLDYAECPCNTDAADKYAAL